ncbi:GNAT family N-acetyltransferase [Candidatus Bathyarchaeota archaeon]|nr:GNAT family N-acetyltransferase [Candidatus Bathyarchaeota archaeon]
MPHEIRVPEAKDESLIKIRPYESRDFTEYVHTLERTTEWGNKAEQELRARMEKMTSEEEIWVAETDNRPVGFMILSPNQDGTLEIDWLDVNPDFQRRGIATILVRKAERIAKTKKYRALSVRTYIENTNMITFLRRNGFEVFERIRNFYGERKDALLFKKLVV